MGFWISLIASVVASWLTVAVVSSKSQSQRERETGTKINKNSNVAQIPIVYGERRVSGTRVFVATAEPIISIYTLSFLYVRERLILLDRSTLTMC